MFVVRHCFVKRAPVARQVREWELWWQPCSRHSPFITALHASLFSRHGDQPHRRIKQQVNKRNKQAVKPNEKKCLQKQKHPPPHPPTPNPQELFSALTWSERMTAAGRRSGDGDEVKHDADGSAASLLGRRRRARARAPRPRAVEAEALHTVVESTRWCWSDGNYCDLSCSLSTFFSLDVLCDAQLQALCCMCTSGFKIDEFLEKNNFCMTWKIPEYLPETVDLNSLYQNHKEINRDPPCCITLLSLTFFPTIHHWHTHPRTHCVT